MSGQHGLVSTSQLNALSVHPSEVKRAVASRALTRVRTGVFVDGEVWRTAEPFRERPLLRVRAAELVLERDHYFSHDSAALLHDLPLPDARRSYVHVTRPAVRGGRRTAGIAHHTAPYSLADTTRIDGLPALSPARTALDLAREHGLVAGVAAMDAVLHRGGEPSDLHRVLAGMPCWPGSRIMRRAVDLADPGAESWLESAARLVVIELGLGTPETQFGLTDGVVTVWCDLRLGRHIIECDGAVKLRTPEHGGVVEDPSAALRAEKTRQDFIGGFGLGISRLTYADCLPGHRAHTLARLRREYALSVRRFGTDVADLERYRVRGRRRA